MQVITSGICIPQVLNIPIQMLVRNYYLPIIQMLVSIIQLWYLYVPIIGTICLGAKTSRCQYVSEKVLGRYISRLCDIIYLSTTSIITLASYLYVLVVLLGSLAKFLRCLQEKYYDGTYDITDISIYLRLVVMNESKCLQERISRYLSKTDSADFWVRILFL